MAGKKAGRRDVWLLAIALFKLLKAAGLVLLAGGLLRLAHADVEAILTHWVEVLRFDPDNHYIHEGLSKIFRVTPGQLRRLSAGSFVYAGLFFTEGIGLLRGKRWAEYMTVVTTGLLIPLEVYELTRHVTWTRAGALILNVLVVWYLAARIVRNRR